MEKLVFIDCEVSLKTNKLVDLGACKEDGSTLHTKDEKEFKAYISNSYFIVGHNIVHHDSIYTEQFFPRKHALVDTLYVSPLLFPQMPYHRLVKDDKLQVEQLNNPLADSLKCMDLFFEEVSAFDRLSSNMKSIYGSILSSVKEFEGFFEYVNWKNVIFIDKYIRDEFFGLICENVNLKRLINTYPVELCYALAIIGVRDKESITPPWIMKNYQMVECIIKELRGTPCQKGCKYCEGKFNPVKRLNEIFKFKDFRKYNNENLQEQAADAAIKGKSLLAIFPTGGGKSVTFQLPALVAGDTEKALTVVISPLQSLMKDQVDNLEKKGIIDAVTINGLLDPIERKNAIERCLTGSVSLLYLAPESLRSKTIEKIMLSRNIARIVIDEAHCFSSWGQDFRVDYLYIGDFIKNIQQKKGDIRIPVSCFTATAKQKVVSDIKDYFKDKLGINLELYTTSIERKNLKYKVIPKANDAEKYQELRDLINGRDCPTIVYCSTVKKTLEVAERLNKDGYKALAFNGKMDKDEKVENQNAFMKDDVRIIVATSAFGMGVDKSDVGMVIHYEISDSLENYVQEAGRAGRDQNLEAECFVLFNEEDLDAHFMLLNQTKLSINEVQQVWSAIKSLSKNRETITYSALEIARAAGWDDSIRDVEVKVKSALSSLESAGYIKRGVNSPRVFATSIAVRSTIEARERLAKSKLFNEEELEQAVRIIQSLISARSTSKNKNDDAESRVDYLADYLGMDRYTIINIIDRMRQANVLADSNDMSATIQKGENLSRTSKMLESFAELERFIINNVEFKHSILELKKINEAAMSGEIKVSSVKNIKLILQFWAIKSYIKKFFNTSSDTFEFDPLYTKEELLAKAEARIELASFICDTLYRKCTNEKNMETVQFSILEMLNGYNNRLSLFGGSSISVTDVENALLYLSRIGAMSIEGGFLVLYSGMQIKRLEMNNAINYKKQDYKKLEEYYNLKIQQIHIIGEYANMMVKDYNQALIFVNDYFQLEYEGFIKKYFKGNKSGQIKVNITPAKYNKLFGGLSEIQKKIIDDDKSQYITVMAGPGSGKTRVLVHKLASLLLLEDIKAEQLLMLTFSRAAATEFKSRLIELIKGAAQYVDIKTFHSYCFDLLGKFGNEEEFDKVIYEATRMIENDEVEPSKITKQVLVIDEAQDMSEEEFNLIKALMKKNENMRVIAVGDDDQNVYEFREADSKFMNSLVTLYGGKKYEMLTNYRSVSKIVKFSNVFVKGIKNRLKVNEIISNRMDNGYVGLNNCQTRNMEEIIINDIIRKNDKKSKIAILTETNADALRMLGVAIEKGLNVRLIQSNEGFRLNNLIELRWFISRLNNTSESPVASDEDWDEAVDFIKKRYSASSVLPIVINMINTFARINPVKYKSDFIQFISESNLDDFIDSNEKIVISTIHKSKGKEYDTVYLMLKDTILLDDKQYRKLYVGMTRAKNNLFIYDNNNILSKLINYVSFYHNDKDEYNPPQIVKYQLGHKDIVLDFFKNEKLKKYIIDNLCSGMKIRYEDGYLCFQSWKIAKLSQAAVTRLDDLSKQGYEPVDGEISFVLAWKGQDDETNKEWAIILADINMKFNELLVIETKKPTDFVAYKQVQKVLTDNDLIKELEDYRFSQSKLHRCEIYAVFGNLTLKEIVNVKPTSREELLSIKGIGEVKLRMYGNDIIDICKKYKR